MKRIRKRRELFWFDNKQRKLDYKIHPGAVLAQQTGWVKVAGEFSSMAGPEPDTINVAVMHTKRIELDLDHVYYVRHKTTAPLWVSFGYSDDPQATIAAITEPWTARWINDRAQPFREWKPPSPSNMVYASDLPVTDRWRYCQEDVDFTDK